MAKLDIEEEASFAPTRFTITAMELGAIFFTMFSSIATNRAVLLKHRKDGRLAIGMKCASKSCNEIHGGLVFEDIKDIFDNPEIDVDRFIPAEEFTPVYHHVIQAKSGNVPPFVFENSAANAFIDMKREGAPKPKPISDESDLLTAAIEAYSCTLGGHLETFLDLYTGKTVLTYFHEDDDEMKAICSVEMLRTETEDVFDQFEVIPNLLAMRLQLFSDAGEGESHAIH